MHLSTLLSTCALALGANALLVPSTGKASIEGGDNEFWDSAKGLMVAEPRKTISLPCTGCPIAVEDSSSSSIKWKTSENVETELQMEFSVDGKQIKLNGQAFYPPSPETMSHPLFAKQVYAADEEHTEEKIYNGDIPISTGVHVHEQMKIATVHLGALAHGENPVTKSPMRRISFEIIGLESQVVRVDTIELWISESDDNLMLYGLNTTPYSKHSTPEGDACTTIVCRVRASIAAKIAAWRAAAAQRLSSARASCMRKIKAVCGAFRLPAPRPHGHMKGNYKLKGGIPKFSGDATLAPGGKNHPHGPYGHHGHRGHHHGAKHVFRMVGRFFRHVVLPIFIGVAAGMAVSGIGMLIGQAIVLLYLRSRRNNGAYQSVEQTEVEGESRDSFEELPKYEEAPEYENAPAYEDEKKEEGN